MQGPRAEISRGFMENVKRRIAKRSEAFQQVAFRWRESLTTSVARMRTVRVRVPATTANLGPGFDCLGIALQIYNWITVTRASSNSADAMIETASSAFFRRSGERPFPIRCDISGDVPRARGLGSSVTVRLGVLHGLNELSGSPLSRGQIFELCAELEGHPDNSAPAEFGGFTIARPDGTLQRYRVDRKVEFVLLIPDFEVSTADARRVLPKRVPLGDAVISLSNACAIAGAFASRDYKKLAGCFDDRLHQPFRQKLVPFLAPVIEAARGAGALGGWLSGSGSTVTCISLGASTRISKAMLAACELTDARRRDDSCRQRRSADLDPRLIHATVVGRS